MILSRNRRAPWLVGLFFLGLLSRWATRTQLVQAWDVGNVVLALSGFDLATMWPT
jgi:hypothetical protein